MDTTEISIEEKEEAGAWDFLRPVLIILLVLAIDQISKIWIKTSMFLGEEIHIFGDWFLLHFTENNGIAFGYEFAGRTGKLLLTLFRLVAAGLIFAYMLKLIKDRVSKGLVISVALIFAGAMGNIVDSLFYGVWFHDINNYEGGFFHGKVVDMLYFPLIRGQFPDWFPLWGGESFLFFRPVFNIADAAITVGVLLIIFFFRKAVKHL